ncbi:YbaB/EbfC family nucleoid-associated protein [bacterium]|nr:YbaB/EbfC family nucleoid-associated protein [bacterium]
MAGMGKILKQAQKMQENMAKMQSELANKEIDVTAGGGMVIVKITGDQRITGLKINPEVVDNDDVQMLEDIILAAVNQAIEESQKMVQQEMQKVTGGMKIPGFGI